ncbi:MAG: B12-binding domain-containing radical SAM protein [Deltaproteobacteria bacterium]|nr:B12-binding domain-containing radical SAM protein [Deltaproteobacteria bacterium]
MLLIIASDNLNIHMKLLLILPKNERGYWGKVSKSGKAGFVRLNLPTIAALTPKDWDVEILDARAKPVDYNVKTDIVGITGFTAEMPSAYEIADNFRKKGITVVMGGVHVSAMPDEALKHADAVVIGEAELVWEKLLEDFKKGGLKPKYRADKLCDMKNMPIPRRDLLDRSMYISGFNTLQATRGCPFNCDYCAVTSFFGNEFRVRPIDEVIEEIKGFDTREFFFMDDNIVGRPKYAKELFLKLIPLNRTWGSQASITMAKDPELLKLYAKSGGKYAFIGLESLSQKNLEKMNKGWNSAEGYKEAIKKIHGAGINIIGSFVFGLDEDDKNVFKNTFDFIMDAKIDAAQFHILTPLPGTVTYDTLEKEGRIIDRDWGKYHTGEVVFQPKGMTIDELQNGYFWIFRNTYTIKNILKRSLRSTKGIAYRIAANLSYRKKALRMPNLPFYSIS